MDILGVGYCWAEPEMTSNASYPIGTFAKDTENDGKWHVVGNADQLYDFVDLSVST